METTTKYLITLCLFLGIIAVTFLKVPPTETEKVLVFVVTLCILFFALSKDKAK